MTFARLSNSLPAMNAGLHAADHARRAADLAQAMCQVLNLAGLFASPRMLARIAEFPSRESARAVLVFLNVASTVEDCETFEEEPSPAYR